MRNLKKILALVLALMMVLSVMVTASATSFVDDADINNQEAVTVLSELGILLGKGDEVGFDPNGTLTRAEAAVMITKAMLGAYWSTELAQAVDAVENPFDDVADSHWGMDYIKYCYNEGLIIGNGKGAFYPSQKLTGYAFGKMLLVAAGAGESEDYLGDATKTWESKVLDGLKKAKFLTGLSGIVLSEELSREDAAQMLFNAMQYSAVVKYGYPVYNGQDKIVEYYDSLIEAAAAVSILNGGTLGGDINSTYYYGTSKVAYKAATMLSGWYVSEGALVDVFGRPLVANWYSALHGDYIYTEYAKPVAEYTTAVSAAKVYSDLKLAQSYRGAYTIQGYVDGLADTTEAAKIQHANNLVYTIGGQGVLTQVYKVDTDAYGYPVYRVVTINTYVGEVSNWTEAKYNAFGQKTAYEHINVTDLASAELYSSGYYATTKFSQADEPTLIKEGTTVTYNKYYVVSGDTSYYRVTNVAAAATGTTTVSDVNRNYVDNSLITFIGNGTTYAAAAKYVHEDVTGGSNTLLSYVNPALYPAANNNYNLWFDAYGNVIKSQLVVGKATTGYALVVNSNSQDRDWTLGASEYQLQLIMPDGTKQVVSTDAATYALVDASNELPLLIKYQINSLGQYVAIDKQYLSDASDNFQTVAGNATITVSSKVDVVANSSTIFYIGTTNQAGTAISWKVVTGVANLPSYVDKTETQKAIMQTGGNVAAMVILDAQAASGVTSSTASVYVVYNPAAQTIHDVTGDYKVFYAFIDGAATSIKIANNKVEEFFGRVPANVLCAGLKYDKGLVVGYETYAAESATQVVDLNTIDTTLLALNVLKIGDVAYSVTENTVVYNVTAYGIVEAELVDLVEHEDYTHYVTALTVDGIITTIYMIQAYTPA